MKLPSVTVIVTLYNAESVILRTLRRVYRQTYPIHEILIIDNHSSDGSLEVARAFAKDHRRIPVRVIARKMTYGLSDSYNVGAKLARTSHIVTLHADGLLPSRYELARLMKPFISNPGTVAAGPTLIHREEEWKQYPFWQKCQFATQVGTSISSGNGKFDAYRRNSFLAIGGYDTKHFWNTMGAEDADMYTRLEAYGRVANSKARVIHAHPVEPQYKLRDWVARRKFLALSYGRYLHLHALYLSHPPFGLLVKPFLTAVTVLGFVHPLFFIPIIIFPFLYMPVMFRSPLTNRDPNIFILPFVLIFLVFYETHFMIYSFWFLREERV